MKKKDLYIPLLILIGLHIFIACAQIGQVSGGEKDSIPPILVGSVPNNYSTNFEEDKIKIYFNEYFKFEKLQDKFVISPPQEEEPEIKIKGKKIVVTLKDSLKKNTTYSLQFADAVEDYTEGNNFDNLSFTFSTGSVIDTLAIGGKLYNAESLKAEVGAFVMLYHRLQDSIPYKQKPNYITRTDSAGGFLVPFIKDSAYYLFALRDQNKNMRFDLPNEQLAFLDSLIKPGAETILHTDTLKTHDAQNDSVHTHYETLLYPNNIKLFMFVEEHRVPYIASKTRKKREQIVLQFPRLLDNNLKLNRIGNKQKENSNWYLKETNAHNDTVSFWITDSLSFAKDTLELEAVYSSLDSMEQIYTRKDTLRLLYKTPEKPMPFFDELSCSVLGGELGYNDSIALITERPIATFYPERIRLFELRDTIVQEKREQALIRYQRPANDSLVFWFKRALPQKPHFNTDSLGHSWYTLHLNKSQNKAMLKILDTSLVKQDTLRLDVNFSNLYYNQAVLKQKTSVAAVFGQQRILKAQRKGNHCTFWLDKLQETKLEIKPLNVEIDNWVQNQQQQIENDSLRVDFWVKPSLSAQNNILVEVQAQDKTKAGKDTTLRLRIGFRNKEQKLLSYQRIAPNQIQLKFDLPLLKEPVMVPENFRSFKVWYDGVFSRDSTTFTATLRDENNTAQDSLSVGLTYFLLDSLGTEMQHEQRLNCIIGQDAVLGQQNTEPAPKRPQAEGPKRGEIPQKKKVDGFELKSWNEIPLTIRQDPKHLRRMWLKAKINEAHTYCLQIDSLFYKTYWSDYNDSTSYHFSMKEKAEYGSINIKLEQVPEHAFLELWDAKGEQLVRKIGSVGNGTTAIELVEPNSYQLRVFIDENKNQLWDTGNFLQNKQPEKMFRYSKVIPVKKSMLMEEQWNLADEKQSFGPNDRDKPKKEKKKQAGF